jgi:hypothetical protein
MYIWSIVVHGFWALYSGVFAIGLPNSSIWVGYNYIWLGTFWLGIELDGNFFLRSRVRIDGSKLDSRP